ncbi:MAG TPA: recombinase family protein [Pseudoflavonifractor sp.]|nr:recombinase family protein [Pseudoflavonifractor sp.]
MNEQKRVYCLYRVSTLGQVEKDDIPMQRQCCHEFCERNGWEIIKEFSEKGVSGFKVSAQDRDAIQEIKSHALQGKFDILLVFMFDRLGRRDDETPFVVEWFSKNGIEVWSTQEGQQRFDNHVDKLMNYLRFWQASGESEKTSIRTKTRLGQIVQEGRFRGGTPPYGYRLEKQGRINKKNHEVNEILVDEGEAALVRLIFQKYVNEGYGAQRLSRYLLEQGYRNRKGANFANTTIVKMLKNIMYTGVLRSGETQSEVFPHLQIVEPELFARAQDIMEGRTQKHSDVPLNSKGQALLSGLVYCAHCGSKLVLTTSGDSRDRANPRIRLRYGCHYKVRHPHECDGQSGYGVTKLDGLIDSMMILLFSQTKNISRGEILSQQRWRELGERNAALGQVKKLLDAKQKELDSYKAEVYKSLSGEGRFDAALLNELIASCKDEVARLTGEQDNLKAQLADLEGEATRLQKDYDTMISWAHIYATASREQKKMILFQLIHKIEVGRDYKINVQFNISYQQYQELFFGAERAETGDANAPETLQKMLG